MWDTECIQPIIRIYPNVKDLNLDSPSSEFLSLIFKHWTGLERLKLTLSCTSGPPFGNWNSIITGAHMESQKNPKDISTERSYKETSIANLQSELIGTLSNSMMGIQN